MGFTIGGNMTNEEKALETLIWINDYIKGLKNSEWNNQSVTWVILNRVETVLKGMNDGSEDIR